MINGRAIDYITQAIEAEEDAAIKAHGLFHSDHEAWAVLKEEVEELLELFDENKIYVDIDKLWDKVRKDEEITNDDVKEIYYWAKKCAEEAVQVMAMCLKWGESNEQCEQEEGRLGSDEAAEDGRGRVFAGV